MYSLKFLIVPIACFMLNGCSFYNLETTKEKFQHSTQKANQTLAFRQWNANFTKLHSEKPVQLLEHQKYPIFYLEQHPEQRGLVLDYSAGAGKTFIAIALAERYADRPIIILAPKFLHSHWLEHLDQYKVKDKSRYRFISYDNCEALLAQNLSESILLVDESHRLIEKVRSGLAQSDIYSRLYLHLRASYKILSLSATPICHDVLDLAYQVNLVAGKDVLPFTQAIFEKESLDINLSAAYWRGHLLTSNFFINSALGAALGVFAGNWIEYGIGTYMAIGTPVGGALGGLLGCVISPFSEKIIPLSQHPLKKFNAGNFKNVINQYFSHYSFENDKHSYPAEQISSKKLYYNTEQLNFLYKFYDGQLNNDQLKQLCKDFMQGSASTTQNAILLNSTSIQNIYKQQPGAGREIGNLPFATSANLQKGALEKMRNKSSAINQTHMLYPAKFEKILETTTQSNGPVIIYSHYYHNGLLLFKQFLDTNGYQGKYALLHPDMPIAQHQSIVAQFNNNKLKILLLHPKIAEGISLKGTQQIHFLEIPFNKSLESQIIGRAIRYRSHAHLPEHQHKVHVYRWYYTSGKLQGYLVSRKNWHREFTELNYYSSLGDKQTIDKNFDLKQESPDVKAYRQSKALDREIMLFKSYLKKFSIENIIHV